MSRNQRLLSLLSFVIVCSIAISNSYFINLKGATVDAERFLFWANEWAQFGTPQLVIDAEFFIQFLGTLISIFDPGEFFLTCLGIALYFFVIVFLFSGRQKEDRGGALVLGAFCYFLFFSPSLILRLGALLREPYVIFFLTLMIYQGARFLESRSPKHFFWALCLGSMASVFHKAALAFFPIFLAVLLIFSLRAKARSILSVFVVGCLFLLLSRQIFPALFELRGGTALEVLVTGDLESAEDILSYKSSRDFRTTYTFERDFSSVAGIALIAIKSNVYYYLAPFPWQISSPSDLFAFAENALRLFLIGALLIRLFRHRNSSARFILICYFLLNAIWALGTSNYGTATRHHITGMPILFFCFVVLERARGGASAWPTRRGVRSAQAGRASLDNGTDSYS